MKWFTLNNNIGVTHYKECFSSKFYDNSFYTTKYFLNLKYGFQLQGINKFLKSNPHKLLHAYYDIILTS